MTRSERYSIVDDLGAEITGIALPVSLCMALTIALVRILNSDGDADQDVFFWAESVYQEQADDSNTRKLWGSMLNALVFVVAVTVLTFVIVLLFKYGCVNIIYAYMAFATFIIFFYMTGGIVLSLCQQLGVHIDYISLGFILGNFAIVGSTILFFQPAPLLMKQGYLMWTGVVVAFVFTSIPEWTTWVLLIAMSLYDLFAVLTPQGPLQMLIEVAIETGQEPPALIFEAAPVQRRGRRQAPPYPAPQPDARTAPAAGATHGGQPVGEADEGGIGLVPPSIDASAPAAPGRPGVRPVGEADEGRIGLVPPSVDGQPVSQLQAAQFSSTGGGSESGLMAAVERSFPGGDSGGGVPPPHHMTMPVAAPAQHTPPADAGADAGTTRARRLPRRRLEGQEEEEDDPYGLGIPPAVKLGLGDFIFYSVLVGRASMYDWMTVYACFISVISGLGMTLWLLALAKKALPALPISIGLGVVFFFLTRYSLEPVAVPAFVNGVAW